MFAFFINAYEAFSRGQIARILSNLENLMITVEQMQTALAEATAKVNEANAKTDALILQVDKNTAETQLMVDIVATLKDQLATAQLTLPNEISDSFIALTESVARLSLANQSVADKLAIQDAIVQD